MLYCGYSGGSHLEEVPTLKADINQLERTQHRLVLYGERHSQLNHFSMERIHLRADPIMALKMFKGGVDLNPFDVLLRPPAPG